jgi:hypothetical protein
VTAVHTALRLRFAAPEWALFTEVRSAAGFDARRTADAVAMNQWPSRGLEIHGVEVKVSRSDWLRELKDPEKSAAVQKYCDRWWVAVSEAAIVKDGELPPTWGLLVLRGDKLVQKVEAPKLEAQPLTRTFVASLLRNAAEQAADLIPKGDVDRRIAEQVKAHRDAHAQRHADEVKAQRHFVEEMSERIRKFEEVSGVQMSSWHEPEKIGEAVRFVLNNRGAIDSGLSRARGVLAHLIETLDGAQERIRREEAALAVAKGSVA